VRSQIGSAKISAAYATWGGDQNSTDGGVDVRVELSSDKAIDGFIPRPNTGFQVKATDMAPSDIWNEMRPIRAATPSDRRNRPSKLFSVDSCIILNPCGSEYVAWADLCCRVASSASVSDRVPKNLRRGLKGTFRYVPRASSLNGLGHRDQLWSFDFRNRTNFQAWHDIGNQATSNIVDMSRTPPAP
jgi:hypothetical protein